MPSPLPPRTPASHPRRCRSIWNTPIGDGAKFEPAKLYGGQGAAPDPGDCAAPTADPGSRAPCPGVTGGVTPAECEQKGCCFSASPNPDPGGRFPWCFARRHQSGPAHWHNDGDGFLVTTESDPPTDWVDQGWWGGAPAGSNCTPSTANAWCHCDRLPAAQTVGQIPLPADWATGVGRPGGNNGVAFLLPDNISVLQLQPVYRCGAAAPLFASRDIFCGHDGACPPGAQPHLYPRCTSILGGGALGAHGGSGLSVLGGTVRRAELLPSAAPISHALKLELFAHQYYYGVIHGHPLQPATAGNGGRTQYVWPATSSDNYCCWKAHPLAYNGSVPAMAPGALLAIPRELAATVKPTTVPGQRIKAALVSYGGYLVDDTASDSAAVVFESGAEDDFEALFNLSLDTSGGPWYDDLLAIFRALHVVVNNGNGTVGGGGRPLTPLAPPLCGAGAETQSPPPPVCGV